MRQAFIWTKDGILSIRPRGTHFSEISFEIQKFSFKKMKFENIVCEIAAICLRLNVLKTSYQLVNRDPDSIRKIDKRK